MAKADHHQVLIICKYADEHSLHTCVCDHYHTHCMHHAYVKGKLLLLDRPSILLGIADHFKKWKMRCSDKKQFITDVLYDDTQRLCHSVVELINKHIPHTKRRWILRRFSQDPVESAFGQIRDLAGSNEHMHTSDIENGFVMPPQQQHAHCQTDQ